MEASTPSWREELESWLRPLVAALGDRRLGRISPLYVAGLIGPGDRKGAGRLTLKRLVWTSGNRGPGLICR
jgi:hypothetical protein